MAPPAEAQDSYQSTVNSYQVGKILFWLRFFNFMV